MSIKKVLSIAGSDPSGGAGVQADLKSFCAHKVYGMTAITALTAQNTQGVQGVFPVPAEFLFTQLKSVSDDITIDAVKIGMLGGVDNIKTVINWLNAFGDAKPYVVLDPVMVATSGERLLDIEAEQTILDLVQLADLVTPNLPELAVLLNTTVAKTFVEMVEQAKTLASARFVNVYAKGGHFEDSDAGNDALVTTEGMVQKFEGEWIETKNTHGTGCSLSSSIAAIYANTGDLVVTCSTAKSWLTSAIRSSDELQISKHSTGHGPVNHFV
ncbi:hypothetical protein FACS1894125_4100 [Actinomycetota bacterium]|nr:hypothetical protein FACS1894125_4100 [Actinomycetota bacterium]